MKKSIIGISTWLIIALLLMTSSVAVAETDLKEEVEMEPIFVGLNDEAAIDTVTNIDAKAIELNDVDIIALADEELLLDMEEEGLSFSSELHSTSEDTTFVEHDDGPNVFLTDEAADAVASSTGVEIIPSIFPDDSFRSWVSKNLDKDQNGILAATEIDSVKEIDAQGYGFKSVKGIELFTNLEVLNCADNELSELNVDKLIKLKALHCSLNQLRTLDVGMLTKLERLSCDDNHLQNLDVSRLTRLELLSCSWNELKSLDVGNQTRLTWLECWRNNIEEINLKSNTQLEHLDVSENRLKFLDVSSLPRLSSLYCGDNSLTELDIRGSDRLVAVVTSGKKRLIDNEDEEVTNEKDANIIVYTYNDDQLVVSPSTKIVVTAPLSASIPTKLQLGVKEKYTLDVPSQLNGQTVKFKSSKASVATISSKGLVTAKKKGNTTLTVTVGKDTLAKCEVKVLPAPSKVTLSSSSVVLNSGSTANLKATLPKNTASAISWSSDKSKVAKVDANGLITAVKAGTAKITAKTFNGKKATCTVTVLAGAAPTALSFESKAITIGVKESVTVSPQLGKGEEAKLTYSSANKKIATVSSGGKITGIKAGETKITVKTHNGIKATMTVKVAKAPSKVTLNESKVKLDITGTLQLKATLPSKTASKITWSSSDKKIAKVDANGLVTAVKSGSATITAKTFNGKKATCKITVSKNVIPTPTPKPTATPAPTEAPTPQTSMEPTEEPTSDPTEAPIETLTPEPVDDGFVVENGILIAYTAIGGDIVIPESNAAGMQINSIGQSVFAGRTDITSVAISTSVQEIGDMAFEGCTALESVTMPRKVSGIGRAAFKGCSCLRELKLVD